jgi:hypothetical protein
MSIQPGLEASSWQQGALSDDRRYAIRPRRLRHLRRYCANRHHLRRYSRRSAMSCCCRLNCSSEENTKEEEYCDSRALAAAGERNSALQLHLQGDCSYRQSAE